MKIHGKGGLLDFSKDKLTERNKENSFLDVDWIITELINYGREKMGHSAVANEATDVPNSSCSSSMALQQRSKSVGKMKKKVKIINARSIGGPILLYPSPD